MKKILCAAAIALAAFVGMTGCDNPTDEKKETPAVTYSTWWIKGSFDGWAENPKHFFVVDELDANKLSFEISGLYKDTTVPLDYEFVLVSPDNKEFKYAGTTNVTPGTAFVLGDSSAEGSTSTNNVKFIADKSSYTVRVDIANAAAPSVKLIAGSEDAAPVTNAVLLSKLQIKGDQFSEINGAEVDAWTGTDGTVSGATISWDVLVDNKNGEFGFNSLNNFLKGYKIDVTDRTAGGDGTEAKNLSNTDGGNCSMTGMPKDGSVYTVSITVDSTKSVADGRYKISVALKTLGTANWAFAPWATVFINGNGLGADYEAWSSKELTISSGVATFEFVANAAKAEFKPSKATSWVDAVGFGAITEGTGSLTLSDTGNIAFDTTIGSTYRISIAFTDTYIADGKPVVTAILVP